jgi:hypothetical protein
MNKESITCESCPIRKSCHGKLKPEQLIYTHLLGKFIGFSRTLNDKRGFINCRHYSCNDGRVAAWNAQAYVSDDSENKIATVVYSSGAVHTQNVVDFGTDDHKPYMEGNGRVVNSVGTIFSRANSKDPRYYQTGQKSQSPTDPKSIKQP